MDGSRDFWGQVKQNASGELDTWTVFWYATIFEHDALCLNPAVTYVENIGLDQTGENCGETTMYTSRINSRQLVDFSDDVSESILALKRTQHFCDSVAVMHIPMISIVARRIKKWLW